MIYLDNFVIDGCFFLKNCDSYDYDYDTYYDIYNFKHYFLKKNIMKSIILNNWGINPDQLINITNNFASEAYFERSIIPSQIIPIYIIPYYSYPYEFFVEFIIYMQLYIMNFKLVYINYNPRFIIFTANRSTRFDENLFNISFNLIQATSNIDLNRKKT